MLYLTILNKTFEYRKNVYVDIENKQKYTVSDLLNFYNSFDDLLMNYTIYVSFNNVLISETIIETMDYKYFNVEDILNFKINLLKNISKSDFINTDELNYLKFIEIKHRNIKMYSYKNSYLLFINNEIFTIFDLNIFANFIYYNINCYDKKILYNDKLIDMSLATIDKIKIFIDQIL